MKAEYDIIINSDIKPIRIGHISLEGNEDLINDIISKLKKADIGLA